MTVDREQAERLHRFSHDLRNRLIGLQQVLEHLRADTSPTEREEFALFGEQQFFKALRDVESVMDDLGVERGSATLTLTRMDLGEFVRTRLEHMIHRFERKKQVVEFEQNEPCMMHGDTRVLADLVDALLSNASKFSAIESRIHLRLEQEGRDALLIVQDHGTGLSPDDLDQVFVRFAWLSNRPTNGEAQGRGTLARARAWAKDHGGSLTATSPGVGEGCTFMLRLPRAED